DTAQRATSGYPFHCGVRCGAPCWQKRNGASKPLARGAGRLRGPRGWGPRALHGQTACSVLLFHCPQPKATSPRSFPGLLLEIYPLLGALPTRVGGPNNGYFFAYKGAEIGAVMGWRLPIMTRRRCLCLAIAHQRWVPEV